MAKKKTKKRTSAKSSKRQRIQCHFVSNTHWDREWRYSAQRTRYMLVYLLDMLFDIFEKEPDFKYFHLDSQTLPIQDYLEARPEREETVRKYVSEGRLLIGPWFCLPDEFCVGGESLIRNLLLGHKIARRFGKVSKTGYSPFSWGQISQMPQIYRGFGIDVAAFYRGVNTLVAPKSEFIWEGPDGSRLIGTRLGQRPRYNVWYLIQRPVYWNIKDVDGRELSWQRGHGPFRFIDAAHCELDYQYAHPEFGYYQENLEESAARAIREQDHDWSTPHRFWSAGHDSSCPDVREVRLIADCDKVLGDKADVFHSTFEAFQAGLRENQQPDWPVVRGEMRHPHTPGSTSGLLGAIISSRTYLKQDNFRTERTVTSYAEPLAVFASLLGAPYPQNFIDLAYNWLLQNHGHDSIGGCSRDIVHEDMLFRSRQSREISTCVLERAMIDIAGSVDLSQWTSQDMALVVYNPAPFSRSEVIPAVIDIPLDWNCESFEITDEQGHTAACQFGTQVSPFRGIVQSPNDVANFLPSTRYSVHVEFKDVPAMGYRTFRVKPVKRAALTAPESMLTGPQTMENEFLTVTVNGNGTLTILHKESGHLFEGLGYFRDSGDIGNPWEQISPPNDAVFTTRNENASVVLVRDGELEASFQVTMPWALPECRSADGTSRSGRMKPYTITNTVTLRRGQPWVEVITDLDNVVEDHYLQVSFPTGIATDVVAAQSQFDVVSRPIKPADYSPYDEKPPTEHPMNSFIDVSDGEIGLALLNEGLKAYEAHDDIDRTLSISLLRCYPLQVWVTTALTDYSRLDRGSQCPGNQSFRYGILPHTGDWVAAKVWQTAERFNLPFLAGQVGPTKHGTEPMTKSFLELKPDTLHLSAVKRSENGHGWIVRLFNPLDKTVRGSLRLNGGRTGPGTSRSPVERVREEFALPRNRGARWRTVREVTLEEVPERDLTVDPDGSVTFSIGKKRIMTFEFLP